MRSIRLFIRKRMRSARFQQHDSRRLYTNASQKACPIAMQLLAETRHCLQHSECLASRSVVRLDVAKILAFALLIKSMRWHQCCSFLIGNLAHSEIHFHRISLLYKHSIQVCLFSFALSAIHSLKHDTNHAEDLDISSYYYLTFNIC